MAKDEMEKLLKDLFFASGTESVVKLSILIQVEQEKARIALELKKVELLQEIANALNEIK